MNDLPRPSWRNPIWYKGYRIYVASSGFTNYEFSHDNYDGAPDAGDNRCGHAHTVEACKARIDELEDS